MYPTLDLVRHLPDLNLQPILTGSSLAAELNAHSMRPMQSFPMRPRTRELTNTMQDPRRPRHDEGNECQPDNPDEHYQCPACIRAWPHPDTPEFRCPAVWNPKAHGIRSDGPPTTAWDEWFRHKCWGCKHVHGDVVWPLPEGQTFHQWLYQRRQKAEMAEYHKSEPLRREKESGQTILAFISAKERRREERLLRSGSSGAAPTPLRAAPRAPRAGGACEIP